MRGSVRLAFHQEPDLLNPYIFLHTPSGEVCNFICDGLLDYDSDSETYVSQLATQVPTVANGGVSADGRTVTYRLQDGVRWSDGQPLTSDAIRFTWEAITHPGSGSSHRNGYEQIEDIECPDPLTAVVHFSSVFTPFLPLFPCLMPRHATGDPAVMPQWPYNWHPTGLGPFKMSSWVRGESIRLVSNPLYRGQPDKPGLDEVLFTFVPDRTTAVEELLAGKVDVVWNLVEPFLPQLRSEPGIRTIEVPGPAAERLILNHADPSVEARSVQDIIRHPHPILGDPRVREAIELAIDKRQLVDRFLYGLARVGTNELHVGWATCDTEPSQFDPPRARALLEEAGWPEGPDGVRLARGARIARDGVPLRLTLHTTANNELRSQVTAYLRESLRCVGIELAVVFAPAAELLEALPRGQYRYGRYDMLLLSQGPEMDPHAHLGQLFSTRNIPTADNGFIGWNLARWVSSRSDAYLRSASSAADNAVRRSWYAEIMDEVTRERPVIYLYSRMSLYACRENLLGPEANVWQWITYNAADWRWA